MKTEFIRESTPRLQDCSHQCSVAFQQVNRIDRNFSVWEMLLMRHIQEVLKSELILTAIPASSCLASFPGSRAGEEEPGTHCLHMRQIPLVTCILFQLQCGLSTSK